MSDSTPVELYRKHRPMSFKQIVGNASAIRTLSDFGKRKVMPLIILETTMESTRAQDSPMGK